MLYNLVCRRSERLVPALVVYEHERPKADLDLNATRCIAASGKQTYILWLGAANLSKVFYTQSYFRIRHSKK